MQRFFQLIAFMFFAAVLPAQDDATFMEEIMRHRAEYKQHFLENDRSPLKADDLPLLRFYEPDGRYRLRCTFQRTPDEKPFELPTYSGITKPFVKFGVLTFQWEGKPQTLAVYQTLPWRHVPMSATHLFLPFRDATSGETTYGGGRYLDLEVKDTEDGEVWLDFNRCYNPWCCYSDGYNCPIPPTENHLSIAVEAGEKMWAGEKKH
jgi:hypothetical protein